MPGAGYQSKGHGPGTLSLPWLHYPSPNDLRSAIGALKQRQFEFEVSLQWLVGVLIVLTHKSQISAENLSMALAAS